MVMEQSISQKTTLYRLRTVLPEAKLPFEEYTTMDPLLCWLSLVPFFRLYPYRPKHFKIVWFRRSMELLQVAQGKTLSTSWFRLGAMNAGVYFVTQKYRRPLDEKLKITRLKFAFRSTDLNEWLKKTLAFFGVRPKRKTISDCVIWKTAPLSVIYGRPVWYSSPCIWKNSPCLDTRPPVRKEV